MTTDDRLNEIERQQAAMRVQIHELRSKVDGLSHVPVSIAKLETQMTDLRGDIREAKKSIDGIKTTLDRTSEAGSRERAANKRAIYALTGVIAASLITALAAVFASGVL